jgi:hypothetical protein
LLDIFSLGGKNMYCGPDERSLSVLYYFFLLLEMSVVKVTFRVLSCFPSIGKKKKEGLQLAYFVSKAKMSHLNKKPFLITAKIFVKSVFFISNPEERKLN